MAELQSKTKIFHNNKTAFKNLLGGALDFIDSRIFLVKERMDVYIGRLHSKTNPIVKHFSADRVYLVNVTASVTPSSK